MPRRRLQVGGGLERDDAGEADERARVRGSVRASSGPPVKQWKIVCVGHALGAQHVERVGPRLAGVDHQRQLQLVGERICVDERCTLHVTGGVVVVVVEAALADGDHLRVVEQDRAMRVDTVARRRGDAGRPSPTRRRSRSATAIAASDVARSQPTVIIVVTPASRAAATAASAPAGMRRRGGGSGCRPTSPSGDGRARARRVDAGSAAREHRLALDDRQPAGVAAPRRRRRAVAGRRPSPAMPMRSQTRWRCRARPARRARRRCAAPRARRPSRRRRRGRARPSTARSPRGARSSRGSATTSPRGRGSVAASAHAAAVPS